MLAKVENIRQRSVFALKFCQIMVVNQQMLRFVKHCWFLSNVDAVQTTDELFIELRCCMPQISSSGAEASDSPEVFCQTIPETLEHTEAGLVNDG